MSFLGKPVETWREEQAKRQLLENILSHAKTHYKFYAGIDLAKQQDKSVVSIIEQAIDVESETKTNTLKYLAPLPQGMDFTKQVEVICRVFKHRAFDVWGQPEIYCDATGIGSVVAELLRDAGLKFKKVLITSGDSCVYRDKHLRVGRARLFTDFRKHFYREDLIISTDLAHAGDLFSEIMSISENTGNAGATYYEASGHDDFAVATALASLAMDRNARSRQGVTTLY